jgi:hypothetical protein
MARKARFIEGRVELRPSRSPDKEMAPADLERGTVCMGHQSHIEDLPASIAGSFLRIVEEIARLGGNVAEFVPPSTETALREKFGAPSA